MNHRLAVLLAAACAACSGSPANDACSAATSNFSLHGSRFPEGVELQWAGTPGAPYEVWGFGPNHEDQFQNPVAKVTGASAAIGIPTDLGTVQIEVRPVVGSTACATTAQALTVPVAPTLTATTTAGGVQLQWNADPLYGPDASIGRGSDANSLETVAHASLGHYLDTAIASGTAYDYVVELHATNLDGFSDPVTAHTRVGAPVVSVLPHPSNIELRWPNPKGALLCTVSQDLPAPAAVLRTDITFGSWAVTCPVGTSCTYRVFCGDGMSQEGEAAIVTSHLAPAAPVVCKAHTAQGGVAIDWSGALPDAASFTVLRSTDGGATYQTAGSTAADSFFDDAVRLFQPARYRVVSVASDGVSDAAAFCGTEPAMAVNAPDAMNVAAATGTAPDFQYPGQTFTVAHGGQLMGLELARPVDHPNCLFVSTTGDPQTDVGPVCASESVFSAGSALAPDQVQGVYYDLSAQQLTVSAGETLRFQINGDFAGAGVARSDSTGAGGATLFGGSSDSAHDLLFKAYVLPSTGLTAPVVDSWAGPGTALLAWTASPSATFYDVLDGSGAVVVHTLDAHATVAVDTAGDTFTVRAGGPSGSAVSAPATVHATGLVADAANLCDSIQGVGKYFVGGGNEFVQTFTATNAGLLARVEFELTTFGPLTVEVLDDQGTVLAQTTATAAFNSFVYSFPPLSRVVPSPVAADLSASGAHVVPGQVLQLRLRNAVSSAMTLRDSADAYPGGDELGFDPPRDLCFQVYVDPSR